MDLDEDDQDSIDDVSMNASDDNELNDDADLDATEADEGMDGDQDDQDDDDDVGDDAARALRSAPSPSADPLSPSDYKRKVAARMTLLEPSTAARHASSYVVEPTAAAPHSAQIYAMTLSADGSILLSGGSDGHVRRYDVFATMNGKSMLTQVLRHGFVEGVTKAGVLSSWWANEDSGKTKSEEGRAGTRFVSPVHSLVCQQDGLWGMSGSESGNINLFGIRHDAGRTRHVLRKHDSAVSAMTLAHGDTELISGGWDKDVHQWDLNTGQVVCTYPGHLGQVSSLSLQPHSGAGLRSPIFSPVRARMGSRAQDDTPDPTSASGSGLITDLRPSRPRTKSGSTSSVKSRSRSPTVPQYGQSADGAANSPPRKATPAAPVTAEVTPGLENATGHENGIIDPSSEPTELTAEEMALEAELNLSLGLALSEDTLLRPTAEVSEPTPPSAAVRLRRESGPGAALGADDGDSDNDSLFGGSGDADADGEADSDAEGEPDEIDAPAAASLALPGGASVDAVPAATSTPERRRRKLAAPAHVNSLPSSSFSTSISTFSSDVLLSTTLVGQVLLWDRRVRPAIRSDGTSKGVRALALPPKTPPWCTAATWSADGSRIYVGRRNESVDEWDVRMLPDHDTSDGPNEHPYPRFHRSLRCPVGSGPVTSLLAMPNSRHLVVGSFDNVRIWDTAPTDKQRSVVPFRVIAGHHGAAVSSMLMDPTARILMTASGDRGWMQGSTEVILLYDVEAVE